MFNSWALPLVRHICHSELFCVLHVASGGHFVTDKQINLSLFFYYEDFKFKSDEFISGYVMNIIPMIPVFTNNIMIDLTSNKPK